MFKNLVFSAFGAGLLVCLAVSALQFVTTEPLIFRAEQFEGGAEAQSASRDLQPQISTSAQGRGSIETQAHGISEHAQKNGGARADADVGGQVHDVEAWAPADGFERAAYTALANLVVGFAVSLMLLGGMVLKGGPVDARHGLLWGVAGFAAVALLPALGLPPELPGTPAADIVARQVWWLAAAAASAGGLALIAFARQWAMKAAGVALLVAPHLIGAPEPPSHAVAYPGALAREFVIASLVVSALLWSLSGLSAGWLHQRLARTG